MLIVPAGRSMGFSILHQIYIGRWIGHLSDPETMFSWDGQNVVRMRVPRKLNSEDVLGAELLRIDEPGYAAFSALLAKEGWHYRVPACTQDAAVVIMARGGSVIRRFDVPGKPHQYLTAYRMGESGIFAEWGTIPERMPGLPEVAWTDLDELFFYQTWWQKSDGVIGNPTERLVYTREPINELGYAEAAMELHVDHVDRDGVHDLVSDGDDLDLGEDGDTETVQPGDGQTSTE